MSDVSKKDKISTDKLTSMIENTDSITRIIDNNKLNISNITFSGYMKQLMDEKKVSMNDIIIRAVISKSFAYQIYSGERLPGRDVLIRVALAMKLTLDETQHMLTLASKGILYPRLRRDAIIIFCISKSYDIYQADKLLTDLNETPLI